MPSFTLGGLFPIRKNNKLIRTVNINLLSQNSANTLVNLIFIKMMTCAHKNLFPSWDIKSLIITQDLFLTKDKLYQMIGLVCKKKLNKIGTLWYRQRKSFKGDLSEKWGKMCWRMDLRRISKSRLPSHQEGIKMMKNLLQIRYLRNYAFWRRVLREKILKHPCKILNMVKKKLQITNLFIKNLHIIEWLIMLNGMISR